jgi:hypothetical protein
MVPMLSLWLPIVASAVAVFILSSVVHMVLRYHSGDFGKLPDEEAVMAALRPFKIPPGDYGMPRAGSMAAMKDPAFQEKRKAGPAAFMTILKYEPDGGMGAALGQWFVYCLVVGLFAGYLCHVSLPLEVGPRAVFRMAGCVAFLGYGIALVQSSIWYRRAWSTTLKNLFDGLLYAAATGGVFAWLWPH